MVEISVPPTNLPSNQLSLTVSRNSLISFSRYNVFKSLAHVQAEKIKVRPIKPEMGLRNPIVLIRPLDFCNRRLGDLS